MPTSQKRFSGAQKYPTQKIFRTIDHPKIFNLVVSKKVVTMLELDENNPYVEVFEVKKEQNLCC